MIVRINLLPEAYLCAKLEFIAAHAKYRASAAFLTSERRLPLRKAAQQAYVALREAAGVVSHPIATDDLYFVLGERRVANDRDTSYRR